MFKEWVIDVTLDPPCFVPYERETDTLVLGMNLIAAKCPDKLVGVVHFDGQEAVEKWIEGNPDWYNRFSSDKQDEKPE